VIGGVWSTANSGPDRYRLPAWRGERLLSAWTVPGLARAIEEAEAEPEGGTA
jgi:hypothetical protein